MYMALTTFSQLGDLCPKNGVDSSNGNASEVPYDSSKISSYVYQKIKNVI